MKLRRWWPLFFILLLGVAGGTTFYKITVRPWTSLSLSTLSDDEQIEFGCYTANFQVTGWQSGPIHNYYIVWHKHGEAKHFWGMDYDHLMSAQIRMIPNKYDGGIWLVSDHSGSEHQVVATLDRRSGQFINAHEVLEDSDWPESKQEEQRGPNEEVYPAWATPSGGELIGVVK